MLEQLSASESGDALIFPLVLVVAFAGGPVLGVLVGRWVGSLFHWLGRKLGGTASVEDVRSAYAWAWIPDVYTLILWLVAIVAFGPELFTAKTPLISASGILGVLFIGFFVIQLIASAWALVLMVAALSEVEHFSTGRAVAMVVLAVVFVALPLFLISLLISGLHSAKTEI